MDFIKAVESMGLFPNFPALPDFFLEMVDDDIREQDLHDPQNFFSR
jgi:hypothetical protein